MLRRPLLAALDRVLPARQRARRLWRALRVAMVTALAFAAVSAGAPHAALARTPAEAELGRRQRAAEALATEAQALFRNKAFAASARQFMEAYATIKRPTLVYNAARAREEQGALKRAESLFLMYLGLPEASAQGKADARKHLVSLRRRMQATAATSATPAGSTSGAPHAGAAAAADTAGVRSTPAAPAPRWPLWVAGGLLVGGGAAYAVAYSQASALDLEAVTTAAEGTRYRDDRDRAQLLRNVAIGLGVGAAGFAALAAWQRLRRPSGQAAAWAPTFSPGGVGVVARF